jgi:hypothetical protein
MQQKYKILLTLLLSLLIGSPSISAQIVDVQGQYVDTTFHDNVNRTAEDSLVLGKDSIVDSILTNIDSNDEVVDDIVERGDSCEADTIGQTESKTTFCVRYCYDKNRTLRENLWDWIAIGLVVLIVLGIIVVGCMHIKLNLWKEKEFAIQILFILVIVFVAIYSDSQWAYLALVVLCLLGIFKFNPNLLERFIKILKAVYGNLETTKMRSEQIEKKVEKDIKNDREGKLIKLQNLQIEKVKKMECLALNLLEKQYPNLQRYVRIKSQGRDNLEVDGLIENAEVNFVVEVRYILNLSVIYRLEESVKRVQQIVNFVVEKTGKHTKILFLIIAADKDVKNHVLEYFNNQPMSDYTPIVKVYTEQELENLNNRK